MKYFFTCLATASSFASLAFAAPASDNPLAKRIGPSNKHAALARMDTLFKDITQHTAVISRPSHPSTHNIQRYPTKFFLPDSTAASFPSNPTTADNATASAAFTSAITSINTLVVTATSDVKGLSKRETAIVERQAAPTGSLPAQLALIIEEIGGALNNIIATLGLSKLHSTDVLDA